MLTLRPSRKRRRHALGRIERLIVENFKSYGGLHEIGPFDKFTCIIGPNGSGKSNIMDAISFCLGIRAKHLRGERLKDLVYRREEEEVGSNSRSAKVMLVFRSASGEELHFGRQINHRGEGSYRIGPEGKMKSVGYDEFIAKLAEHSIFVKARNFLVFQGDVMELARRQGTDLTGVLETISGSDQLREEYDRLARELEVTQEKSRMHFQHRREIEGAVAMLERQRAEVRRYQDLRARKGHLELEIALFKLFCADCEFKRNESTTAHLRSELARVAGEMQARRKEAEEAEELRKKTELEGEKATSHHFVIKSNLEQLKPEISNCKKQSAHWSKKLREKEEQMVEEETRQQQVESELQAKRKVIKEAEREIVSLRGRQVESAVVMTEAQRAEYEEAASTTAAMNSRTCERLRETEEQLATIAREVSADKRDIRDLEEQRAKAAHQLVELASERQTVAAELTSLQASVEQRKKNLSTADEECNKFYQFQDALVEEQRALRFQLDGARARRERLDQMEVKQRVADELRDAFPAGVLGRLSELVLPTQRRFDLPLQMSMGALAEAFVVTDSIIGRECVRYLKERQISTETFLQLDRIRVPDVGPTHLLTQGFSARRLATMCVQHNERFLERHPRWTTEGPALIDKAIQFLLAGTVIVDDLEEAKSTAYRDAKARGLQPRVVTLDGEVISPNGNMSVHSIGSLGRVEFGGAEQIHEIKAQEQKLAQVEKDINTLREELTRLRQRAKGIKEQASEFDAQKKTCEQRLEILMADQAKAKKAVDAHARRKGELTERAERQVARAKDLERIKETLESELLRMGGKYFAKLNAELGVEDIRDLMWREQRERRKLREEIEQAEDALRVLQNEQQSLEQRAKVSSKLETMRRDVDQYKSDIDKANTREKELAEKQTLLEERSVVGEKRVKELNQARESLENEVRSKKIELQRIRAQQDETRKNMKKHQEKIRHVLTTWCSILRDCDEKQVDLPYLEKSEEAIEMILTHGRDLDEMRFEDMEKSYAVLKVNFTPLSEEKMELARETIIHDLKQHELEYEAQIADIVKEMSGLNPNMRAPEEFKAEEGRLREIKKLADQANTDSQKLQRQFENVKAERVHRFMTCFRHVEAQVHPFYKELTSYDGNEGGSAYLDLDDAEEPYNGGITFTACPPGKRFFPMELLSGGERSMASMALLFAMHSFQPPPFMILDEVDAPFDRKNTGSLVHYLRKLDFQCLVISLKDTFFAHSDSIVGIYKDKELQCSGSLILALKRLGDEGLELEDEVPETERPRVEVEVAEIDDD